MSAAEEQIYAAHLYPPAAIPELVRARALMRQAQELLEQLLENGGIKEGDPAEDALQRLDDAIGMMEPDDEDGSDPDAVAEPRPICLVVDNTRPEVR